MQGLQDPNPADVTFSSSPGEAYPSSSPGAAYSSSSPGRRDISGDDRTTERGPHQDAVLYPGVNVLFPASPHGAADGAPPPWGNTLVHVADAASPQRIMGFSSSPQKGSGGRGTPIGGGSPDKGTPVQNATPGASPLKGAPQSQSPSITGSPSVVHGSTPVKASPPSIVGGDHVWSRGSGSPPGNVAAGGVQSPPSVAALSPVVMNDGGFAVPPDPNDLGGTRPDSPAGGTPVKGAPIRFTIDNWRPPTVRCAFPLCIASLLNLSCIASLLNLFCIASLLNLSCIASLLNLSCIASLLNLSCIASLHTWVLHLYLSILLLSSFSSLAPPPPLPLLLKWIEFLEPNINQSLRSSLAGALQIWNSAHHANHPPA